MSAGITRRPSLLTGAGASRLLLDTVAELGGRRVLVVASARARGLPALDALDARTLHHFSRFRPNPTLEDALAGAAAVTAHRPDVVVAVGGGSAIDTAKLARALPADPYRARRILRGEEPLPDASQVPLIAVPTTAGAGSEVTRFATVYVDGVKHSLDHPRVLPDRALVDPDLLLTCPLALRYACAFDALCHAVESYWSLRATPDSRRLAMSALHSLLPVLTRGLADPPADGLNRLAEAATRAGQAIDITRTTAAHAFAYHLTARFGIPHGVACLLNLLWLAKHNLQAPPAAGATEQTTEAVRQVTAAIPGPAELRALLRAGGYPGRLRDYGIGHDQIPEIVAAGTNSTRADNNPAELTTGDVTRRLHDLV